MQHHGVSGRTRATGGLILVFCLAALCVLLTACPYPHYKSCGRGFNMSNVRLAEAFYPLADTPVLVIQWDPGEELAASLPDAYFADVAVGHETDPDVIDLVREVVTTGPGELEVRFRNLADFLGRTDQLTLVLEFPDRSVYLDCDHPGMDDRYLLTIELAVNSAGVLANYALVQSVFIGPI